ncbi:hypothetical protein [Pseudovibrio sp. Tun.PSC04-5.I4]|uniref:hypothetical protein n=1 Tax=Pseudovibrio sp. Tun.PSC04-5.I4 TaxID=1798213 RepID=UPI0008852DDF|nr:hypothetical protein [Pseudovibrio sp. Tun.PSC04-5.I4]SDR47923.1 hypothetical protein SAMN04515695_5886 [Pseudovibrio sp. Tun.PSC04-5.I4]
MKLLVQGRVSFVLWRAVFRALVLFLFVTGANLPAFAEDIPWAARIGSWNLKNFGESKAGFKNNKDRSALMRRIARVAQQDHIIFFQEVQGTGRSIKGPARGLQHFMPAGWKCDWVSRRSTKRGNGERYSYCVSPSSTYKDGPPITVKSRVDYLDEAGPYTAVNGSTSVLKTNIWARPPLLTTISVPMPEGEALEIQVYDNHLKPRYGAGPRVPGVDPTQFRNFAVANELIALEKNLKAINQGALILGDLNADCTYFSEQKKPGKFEGAAGWTWWIDFGVRTNVLADAACAYDRFITNAAVTKHVAVSDDGEKKGYDIEVGLIKNQTLSGVLVSDHYKVSLLLEGIKKKKPKAQPMKTPVLVSLAGMNGTGNGPSGKTGKKRKHSSGLSFPNAETAFAPNYKTKNSFNAQNLTSWLPAGATANFYIVKYDEAVEYGGVADVSLKDARGSNGPTAITIATDGTFGTDVEWLNAPAGGYKLVLDVNKDGILNIKGGDIVNVDSGIDLLSYPKDFHSDIVTLGDNHLLRGQFSENRAQNIYGLAKGLGPDTPYKGYIVSRKLLAQTPGWKGWADAREAGLSNLAQYAIPINQGYGPILFDELKPKHKEISLTSDALGHAFLPIWKKPAVHFNMRALDTKPSPASWQRDQADDKVEDPCLTAWKGKDKALKAVCNAGHSFSDTYGTAFNFVIDVNHDGHFGAGDLVDTYDVGDMRKYFEGNDDKKLGTDAGDGATIVEYKDFLNARLNLIPPLDAGPAYTAATKAASNRYACNDYLTRNEFLKLVVPDSDVGFYVVDQDVYRQEREFGSGFYEYENLNINAAKVKKGATVCADIEKGSLGTITTGKDATFEVRAENLAIVGSVRAGNGSKICLVAKATTIQATGVGATLLFAPEPTGATKIAAGIAGGVILLSTAAANIACAF